VAPLASRAVCVWNRNISNLREFGLGASQDARHDLTPLSATDVFLTVAIMSVGFLTEIALFILIGMI
jgi:hypothetical protein